MLASLRIAPFRDHTAGLTSDIDRMDVELPEDDVQPIVQDSPFKSINLSSNSDPLLPGRAREGS